MSDNDTEVEVNPIMTMIDYAMNADFNKANAEFSALMNQRMSDALEQEKIAVASGIFNDSEDEEEFEMDEDDEALEDAVDEYENDEEEE